MKSFIYESTSHKIAAAVTWVVFVSPFLLYTLTVYWYAANVPYQDDYDVVLGFLLKFDKVQTLREKIILLFAQHNEHRIVFDRLIFLIYHALFGEVNFKALILFGNLGWIAATLSLILYLRKIFHLSWVEVMPLPYLLLSFSHWENMFFAMAGIQNYWFILFAIAFLSSLLGTQIVAHCTLFAVALFTSGGGVILYPIGNLFLLLQRKWKPLAYFFVLSSFCLALYFYGYHKPAGHPSIVEALWSPLRTTTYFLMFLGNVLPLDLNRHALLFGVVLALFLASSLFKRRETLFYSLLIGFVLLIDFTTTLTRSGFGVEQATSSRYSMFPLLLWACLYAFLISGKFSSVRVKQLVIIGATLGAILFWTAGIYAIRQKQFFSLIKDERLSSIAAFREGEQGRLLYPSQKRAAQLLTEAEQKQLYTVHAGND